MSKLKFSQELDRDQVLSAQIQGLFTVVENWIGVPSIGEQNVKPGAIEYRNTKYPMSIELAQEYFTGDGISPGEITFSGAFGGYHAILESVLTLELGASYSQAANRYEVEMPVAFICAKVHQSAGNAVSPNNIQNYCLGHSTDGGVTWTPLLSTRRPCGPCGGGFGFIATTQNFFSGSQFDYMVHGGGPVTPRNANFDKRLILMASLGGKNKDLASETPRKIAVMVDSAIPADGVLMGRIEASIRWDRDTP